jgi:hypothetical protein
MSAALVATLYARDMKVFACGMNATRLVSIDGLPNSLRAMQTLLQKAARDQPQSGLHTGMHD